MWRNGLPSLGTNAVVRRPRDRYVVGKVRAIALVRGQCEPVSADRVGHLSEPVVRFNNDDQPSGTVFETRKRHLDRKEALEQGQGRISPLLRWQERRADGTVRRDAEACCIVVFGPPAANQWLGLGRDQEEPHSSS